MARPIASSTDALVPVEERKPGFSFEDLPERTFSQEDMTSGMLTSIPREKRPLGSGLEVFNGRVRDDWVGKRPGHKIYIPKPDSDEVIHLSMVEPDQDEVHLVRVTRNNIHVTRTSSAWTASSGPAIGAAPSVDSVQFIDRLILATRSRRLIALDAANKTHTEIADSPFALYVANFGDRVVAAGIAGFGIQLAWSANADHTDWTSESAGLENLIQGEGGAGDDITRLFGYETVLIILRQRTIWHATRQPFATAPFRFTPVIHDQGCDLPFSAVKLPDGVIFADRRTNGVFFYRPNTQPIRISVGVEDDLMADIALTERVRAAYDPAESEYHLDLHFPGTLTPVITWVYSRIKENWTRDEGATKKTSAIASLFDVETPTMIDDVPSFINDVPDTIDSFQIGPLETFIFRGRETGEVLIQTFDANQDFDEPVGGGALAVQDFDFVFLSQDLGSVSNRRTIKDTLLDVDVELTEVTEQLSVSHSRDEGVTLDNTKTLTTPSAGRQEIGLRKRQITGNRLFFKFVSRTRVRLHGFWIRVMEKGPRRTEGAASLGGG